MPSTRVAKLTLHLHPMTLRILITVAVFALFPAQLLGQTGKVFDNLSMPSRILKGERKYAVYLPPDYETAQRSYPVLYLLHGGGDDQTGWVQFGEVQHIADKAIREGKATPMVIVMPDANTGRRGYFNDINGEWRYEDFFFEEFIPFIEKKYRIRGEKRYRAVAGLSMGGGGSFMYALHRPDMFSSAAPLSASTGPLSIEEFKNRLRSNNHNDNCVGLSHRGVLQPAQHGGIDQQPARQHVGRAKEGGPLVHRCR